MKRLNYIISVIIIANFITVTGCKFSVKQSGPTAHKHSTHTHGQNSPNTGSALTKHYENSILKMSEKALFSAEMILRNDGLKTGKNALDIIIHNKEDQDVLGARVNVIPWMPSMGHGVFEKAVVTEKGGGVYHVKNVYLSMKGHWQLKIEIKDDRADDLVVFDFPLIQQSHKHSKKIAKLQTDMDYPKTVTSANKLFTVSYESNITPIPINRIHSWNLKITDNSNSPVLGATFFIKGDMPEHGHGLPTAPKVTKELGEGNYLLNGIKFNMPGWWTIEITITSGELKDKVLFNLNLK